MRFRGYLYNLLNKPISYLWMLSIATHAYMILLHLHNSFFSTLINKSAPYYRHYSRIRHRFLESTPGANISPPLIKSEWRRNSSKAIQSCCRDTLETKIPDCVLGSPSVMPTLTQQIATDAKMETDFFLCTGGLMIFSHENDPAMVSVCWQWAGRETYVSTLSLGFHAGQTEVCCKSVLQSRRENSSIWLGDCLLEIWLHKSLHAEFAHSCCSCPRTGMNLVAGSHAPRSSLIYFLHIPADVQKSLSFFISCSCNFNQIWCFCKTFLHFVSSRLKYCGPVCFSDKLHKHMYDNSPSLYLQNEKVTRQC